MLYCISSTPAEDLFKPEGTHNFTRDSNRSQYRMDRSRTLELRILSHPALEGCSVGEGSHEDRTSRTAIEVEEGEDLMGLRGYSSQLRSLLDDDDRKVVVMRIDGKMDCEDINSTPPTTTGATAVDGDGRPPVRRLGVRLGEDAIEYCIPPPHRSPTSSISLDHLHHQPGHRSSSNDHRLKNLKRWKTFHPLPIDHHPIQLNPFISPYDLKSLSISPLDSHRRGFWLIPVWKDHISSNDFYARFGHLISLPTWIDPKLSPSDSIQSSDRLPSTPIVWNPYRLALFWTVITIICEKHRLGDITAIACSSSHSKHTSPSNHPQSVTHPPSFDRESQDIFGDHLRIWSDLRTSLIVRRVISDVSIKTALQAAPRSSSTIPPFLDLQADRDVLEPSTGSYDHKWLKACTLMWFDETGTPRGYG